jgi:hypothetical protein
VSYSFIAQTCYALLRGTAILSDDDLSIEHRRDLSPALPLTNQVQQLIML